MPATRCCFLVLLWPLVAFWARSASQCSLRKASASANQASCCSGLAGASGSPSVALRSGRSRTGWGCNCAFLGVACAA
eukprot:6677931-Lingulodinium_polyedra.AAC.1